MRKYVAVLLVALTILVSTPLLGAENEPTTFINQVEANGAFHAGHFARYIPFAKAKNQVEGEKIKTENAILAELFTHPHGWRWVIYLPGDELIWSEDRPIGDPRCGNPIRAWAYPSPAPPPQQPTLIGLPTGRLEVDVKVRHEGEVTVHHEVAVKLDTPKKPAPTGWQKCWAGNLIHAGPCRWVARVLLVGGGIALASGGDGHETKRGDGNTIP